MAFKRLLKGLEKAFWNSTAATLEQLADSLQTAQELSRASEASVRFLKAKLLLFDAQLGRSSNSVDDLGLLKPILDAMLRPDWIPGATSEAKGLPAAAVFCVTSRCHSAIS